MANLDMARIENEITWRLFNTFNNREAEKIIKQRCMDAIKNKTLKSLYKPIKLCTKIEDHFFVLTFSVNEPKIVTVLNETGVHDLICMCINAQS